MKKLLLSAITTAILITPLISLAKPPITCPPVLEYTCVADSTCPRSRCTVTSSYASPFIFLAPYQPLKGNKIERSSCSILEPGKYSPEYLVSIYGPAKGVGWIAYCMYGTMDSHGFAISAFYSPEYTKGKGEWRHGVLGSPTSICQDASECEFDPLLK